MAQFFKFGNYKINADYIKYAYLSHDGTCNIVIKNTAQYGDGRNPDIQRVFPKNSLEFQDCINFINQREKTPIFNLKY